MRAINLTAKGKYSKKKTKTVKSEIVYNES